MMHLKGWLAASVILNIFLFAAVAGGVVWLDARPRMITAGSLRIVGSELPEARRRAFVAALRETRRALRPTAVDARQARIEAARLLRQPQLDQAALSATLDRLRSDEVKIRAAVEARAVSFSATLPLGDRAKLASSIDRPARQRQSWWRLF